MKKILLWVKKNDTQADNWKLIILGCQKVGNELINTDCLGRSTFLFALISIEEWIRVLLKNL